MKQFARRKHSSVLGDGPKQERWKTWARVLPSSGRHLIASFDSAIVFGYLNCNPVTASKLLSIDRQILTTTKPLQDQSNLRATSLAILANI